MRSRDSPAISPVRTGIIRGGEESKLVAVKKRCGTRQLDLVRYVKPEHVL